MHAKIYTIANRKGGCSKTTTVKAMAEILSYKYGKKVLCIDCDPQGNLTRWSGVNTEKKNTIYEVITNKCFVLEALEKTKYYDILPADEVLSQAELELTGIVGHEYRLKEALNTISCNYDYILIDTPPNLGFLSILAFVAADSGILIVTDSGMFATEGISKLSESLSAVQKFYNSNAKVQGILMTKFNPHFKGNQKIKELSVLLSDYYNAPLFETRIRSAVAITDATTYGINLLDCKPQPKPVADYIEFINELLKLETSENKECA